LPLKKKNINNDSPRLAETFVSSTEQRGGDKLGWRANRAHDISTGLSNLILEEGKLGQYEKSNNADTGIAVKTLKLLAAGSEGQKNRSL